LFLEKNVNNKYKDAKEDIENLNSQIIKRNIDFYFNYLNSINNYFLIGIIEGDGSFYVSLRKNGGVRFGFNITTHILELDMLYAIKIYLDCGIVIIKPTWCRFVVEGNKDLINILMVIVDSVGLLGSKADNYLLFPPPIKFLILYTKLKIL